MDEIGLSAQSASISKQDPTFQSVLSEKKQLLKDLPAGEEELYGKWKRLEGHEEFLDLQEVSKRLSSFGSREKTNEGESTDHVGRDGRRVM
jgi:hypothetical protein